MLLGEYCHLILHHKSSSNDDNNEIGMQTEREHIKLSGSRDITKEPGTKTRGKNSSVTG